MFSIFVLFWLSFGLHTNYSISFLQLSANLISAVPIFYNSELEPFTSLTTDEYIYKLNQNINLLHKAMHLFSLQIKKMINLNYLFIDSLVSTSWPVR